MSLLDRFKHLFGVTQSEAAEPTHTPPSTQTAPATQPVDRVTPSPIKRTRTLHNNFICAVVGESHKNKDGKSRQTIIKRSVSPGMAAELRREPDNKYDPNAVAVFVDGQQIGYLKREVAERLCYLIDDPAYVAEALVNGVYGGTPDKPSVGVTLDLSVYEIAL
jgi:hypothetical protein